MRRSGFTLIELLAVFAIMGIMFAIAVGVYAQSIEQARIDATVATVRQVHRAVVARSEALTHYNIRSLAQTFKAQYDTAGNPSPNDKIPLELATVLVTKNRYRASLPQRLEDLWGFDQQPGTPDDSPLWAIWKKTCNAHGLVVTDATPRPTGHRIDLENSELLHLFLSDGPVYSDSSFVVERLNPAHVQDVNENGLPEIVDSWGQPIRFYNWPTRLIRPGGNGLPIDQATFIQTARQFLALMPPPDSPVPFPYVDYTDPIKPVGHYDHPLNQDPDDPLGAMAAAVANGFFTSPFSLNLTPFGASPTIVTSPPFDEPHYHTSETYWAPLVISAGPDTHLGLIEPTDQTAPERRNADIDSIDDALDNVSILQ